MALVTGQVLQGRYRILHPLGQGGMGQVYLAEDARLGSRCAVKESAPDPSASPAAQAQLRQQFQLEAHTLANLSHANLPRVTDYFSEGGNEYLVMEYVEGEDLASILARHGGPLPEQQVLSWAEQVLEALDYLHTRYPNPIIHRDIKPANIILTPQGRVKLVDFGLAKLFDPTHPRTGTAVKGLGTPAYTPLEQYVSSVGHTDARSDIYALGATLYHMLTNAEPAESPKRSLNPGGLVAPRQLAPLLSAATEAAVLKAMAVHPDQRFQSAREMQLALWGSANPVGPVAPVRSSHRQRLPVWIAAILGVYVVVVLVWQAARAVAPSASTPAITPARLGGAATAIAVRPTATSTPIRVAAFTATNDSMPAEATRDAATREVGDSATVTAVARLTQTSQAVATESAAAIQTRDAALATAEVARMTAEARVVEATASERFSQLSTLAARQTQTAEAIIARSTQQAVSRRATADVQAQATQTASQLAGQATTTTQAQLTQTASVRATQQGFTNQATAQARLTQTAMVRATEQASTATAQARLTQTAMVRATEQASAIQATATTQARLIQTAMVRATEQASAIQATATAQARLTQTAVVRATEQASAIQATATAQARLTQTAVVRATEQVSTATAQAQVTQTAIAQVTEQASAIQATATAQARTAGIYDVKAEQDWQDTGWAVGPGDIVSVRYIEGLWSVWAPGNDLLTDGNGLAGRSETCKLVPEANLGALVGRIGNSSPYLIGNERSVSSTTSGNLELSMNDCVGTFQDNIGSLKVVISTRQAQQQRIIVGAQSIWQNTTMSVSPGETVQIQYVEGVWTISAASDPYTDGNGQEGRPQQCGLLSSSNLGALVGRVGDGTPFHVGNTNAVWSPTGGMLFLSINDCGDFADNDGSLTVDVTIRP